MWHIELLICQCDLNAYLTFNFFFPQKIGTPVKDRHRENQDRPKAFEELGKSLQLISKAVDLYKAKVSIMRGGREREIITCNIWQCVEREGERESV